MDSPVLWRRKWVLASAKNASMELCRTQTSETTPRVVSIPAEGLLWSQSPLSGIGGSWIFVGVRVSLRSSVESDCFMSR